MNKIMADKDPFEEYLRESEPDKAIKGYAWSTAIGLQAVDGLKPSKYLIDTAIQNIEGKITIKEAQSLIEDYYRERPTHWSDADRTVPFPVSWTVKMKKKQKETQDILSYHTQAAGCSDKARAKASGGRQPIEECGRTGL